MSKVKKEKTKKGKVIRNIIIGVVLAVIALIIVSNLLGKKEPLKTVSVQSPVMSELEESLNTSGMVNSSMSKIYYSKVSATVDDVAVREGMPVKKGDTLLTYDEESLQKELTTAELNYRSSNITYTSGLKDGRENQSDFSEAKTNLEVLKQQIKDLEAYAKRLQKQYDDMVSGDSSGLAIESTDLQSRLSALNTAAQAAATPEEAANIANQIAQIQKSIQSNAIAQKNVGKGDKYDELQKIIDDTNSKLTACKEYQAQMETQKTKSEAGLLDSSDREKLDISEELSRNAYDDTKEAVTNALDGIKAEFDGIVTSVAVQDGMMIQQGLTMFVLESNKEVEVQVGLTKYDLANVKVGQKAIITINSKEYEGTVQAISRKASSNAQGTAVLNAVISIDNADDDIFLGVEASVCIITAQKAETLCIPVEALNADRDGEFVYLVVDNFVQKRYVTKGISSDTSVEILEGITVDDKIITDISADVTEGLPVIAIEKQ